MLNELIEIESNLSTKEVIVKSFSVAVCDLYKLQQQDKQQYPFLLESIAVSESKSKTTETNISRYSILFAYPQETHQLTDINQSEKFNANVQKTFAKNKQSNDTNLPFTGGWFCYFSYDYAQVIEPTLSIPQSNLPIAIITRIPCAYIYDNVEKVLHLVAEVEYKHHLATMVPPPGIFFLSEESAEPPHNKFNEASEEKEQKYLSGIQQIKEYILSGDVFQVNLSRQWQVQLLENQQDYIYQLLRKSNPAPFAANVYFDDFQIISSSPERLVKYDAKTGWVETRPIAGTRKRSECKKEDKALVEELINHPKEIAEHVMLIDLERNDLGRICEIGTVEVNELMSVETYQHVHHIVSNIRGKLKRGLTPLSVIHAVFPGGTITGCPKIRCMEIIAELEKMPRDVYTGSIGYINRDGSMDTNILIRTMMVENNTLTFRAGAGIVADSVEKKELEEARHKAKGLIQSLSHC